MSNILHQPPTNNSPELEVLSPHYDDAVYSCWQALNDRSRVVTLFTGYPTDEAASDWDISTGFNNSRLAMEAREEENKRALIGTGAATIDFAFKDVVYRQDDNLTVQQVLETIDTQISPDSHILAPAGFTYSYLHPDHVITREVAKLLMQRDRRVTFYADIPYSLQADNLEGWPEKLPINELKRLLGTDVEVVPCVLSEEQAFKKEVAVRAYISQFDRNNALAAYVFNDPNAYRWEALIRPV